MVTYTDTAIAAFASLALSLASAGCPWLQAEAQRILQARHSPCPYKLLWRVNICVNMQPLYRLLSCSAVCSLVLLKC